MLWTGEIKRCLAFVEAIMDTRCGAVFVVIQTENTAFCFNVDERDGTAQSLSSPDIGL
jgi:hypothetical protein